MKPVKNVLLVLVILALIFSLPQNIKAKNVKTQSPEFAAQSETEVYEIDYSDPQEVAEKLKADDIQGSTFTISNVGTFRNLMGTPIINQPEVAILATGSINKRAVAIERDGEHVIAIRSMMYLSLSFDHRVVDGNLGGSFLARIGDFLEDFDSSRVV